MSGNLGLYKYLWPGSVYIYNDIVVICKIMMNFLLKSKFFGKCTYMVVKKPDVIRKN